MLLELKMPISVVKRVNRIHDSLFSLFYMPTTQTFVIRAVHAVFQSYQP